MSRKHHSKYKRHNNYFDNSSKSRILFILKRRQDYDGFTHSKIGVSTGLYNSAKFVSDMLVNKLGIESEVVVVVDNNDIDREVTRYKPTHVIIEALWVVPSKFAVLTKLHPKINWIIRMHSETPFIASEGIAMDWLMEYLSYSNVFIACNAPRFLEELETLISTKYKEQYKKKLMYLPNYYPKAVEPAQEICEPGFINIGCFGAIRPLKNHLIQAIAAVKFANQIKKKLKFHINVGRVEMKGEPILHNLQYMFKHLQSQGHQLVEHPWMPHEEFIDLLNNNIDIGVQVTFSETFNIVCADLISQGIPIVASAEMPWSVPMFDAEPTDCKDIVAVLHRTYNWPKVNVWLNKWMLNAYCRRSALIWNSYFRSK